MPMTMLEKIFSHHSKDEVKPDSIIWLDLDVRTARDFGGANVVKNFQHYYAGEKVDDPAKTFFTFDCVVPANTIAYAENQQLCRIFAKEQGIKVYDVDAGIGSHVVIEQGIAVPGGTLVGTDSHLNILGAIGCFGQGMGDLDIAFAFKTGRTWFEVPPSIKITLKGTYSYPTTAKDLVLYLLRKLGSSGCLGKSVELYGEMVDKLSLADRITVASMGTEMGAIIILIPPNEEVLNYCQKRANNPEIKGIYADTDAVYEQEIEIDINNLQPQVAKPPKPSNVVDAAALSDVKVDSVFIGSCTDGTYQDIEMAASILKGQKVAPHVMAKVVPATKEVYGQMLKSGLLDIFYESGVIVSNPGCGGCAAGQIGMTGKGEVQVSTSNRNFAGKQGTGDTYLASPVIAAASALTGRISLPALEPCHQCKCRCFCA